VHLKEGWVSKGRLNVGQQPPPLAVDVDEVGTFRCARTSSVPAMSKLATSAELAAGTLPSASQEKTSPSSLISSSRTSGRTSPRTCVRNASSMA
jgi:hypothetical protein